ncbi:50S ribosomal protein L10 [Lacticaseibacillus thailandensis]|uniref:Large ribosomal subunit protein uL10 n=1 Tax=Lacticaseibacillus thailandensis DSM 22698 = JCM 13996 TaxID=1423810 RepID=A0A0R2C3G1_9LACO|nr:50S ribosomal protein L10 [Lacticaseibacillus thailandensis]KRM86415.1 rplJ protein [Lacticaseibacillus thailandensis DSM 22698 = JCM 13996]
MSEAIIAEKAKVVDEVAENLKNAATVIVIDYRGLTVDQVTQLRKELRESDSKMEVVKNTYLRRAADKVGYEGLDELFTGPTAILYSETDVVAPARIGKKFAGEFETLKLKGGIIQGEQSSLEEIEQLASLPDRDGLISMVASAIQAPVRDFAYVIKAIADSKDEEPAA